ncbi:MAG: alpha/beta hydrolase [Chloroflexi bacterium]|nr:alpha/beta hydrolase [Chloroflexota bacterium]
MKLELLHEKAAENAKETPILFVHGKWHAAWCWREHFMPCFAQKGYDAYALSLRGHGGSEGHERLRWHSIADYVEDVAWAVRQIGKPPILVGHSMGGFIVQKYLEAHHEIPAAVLLTPVPYYGLWQSTWQVFRRHPLIVLRVLVTMRLYPVVETPQLAREGLFSKDLPAEALETYHRQLQDESFRAYLDELGLNLVRPRRVKTPLMVIGAENDAVVPLKTIRDTARAYRTEAIILPGLAHDSMLDPQWQVVADRILGWLTERGL